jgi:hypothetical protein
LLLLIFTLSSTPKRYLHDIFANHTEAVSHQAEQGKLIVSEAGFNCDCDNLVGTSPCDELTEFITYTLQFQYPLFLTQYYYNVPAEQVHFFELRGPPVFA